MFPLSLALLLLIAIAFSRVYDIELSVDDNVEWTKENNASVYFFLTTNLNGVVKDSPAYLLQDGLPGTATYAYSLLLDDIGDATLLRIFHSDSNKLCFNSITVDHQTATRDYDCSESPSAFFECQEIGAYFDTLKILHAAEMSDCQWTNVVSHTLLKEYTIELTTDASYYSNEPTFYHNIGLSLEGFVFDSYLTPYYNLSSLTNGIYHWYIHILEDDNGRTYDKLSIRVLTYDVTPLESIWIGTQNTDYLCINTISVSVTNADPIMNVQRTLNESNCISYPEKYKDVSPHGCSLLSVHFRKDQTSKQTQPDCEIADTSFESNKEQRSATTKYTLTMAVSEGTTDYIFYQMEGHTGDRTECFYTAQYQLELGRSTHEYNTMKNVGNPKILYVLHDRDDDICINYIKIHNDATNDTIIHDELICSVFLYSDKEPGRCNVITVNFELGTVTNVVSPQCPFAELCEFGLYEHDMSSPLSAKSVVVVFLFICVILIALLSLLFGYQCIWCHSVYSCLIHCWDPFVTRYWNPQCEERLCHCSNTTDMQHNLCCYCCGCDYCNPFSIHRRRMDKKTKNEIAKERKRRKKQNQNDIGIDEYDTDDGDALNLTTRTSKYDMGGMDTIDLGDNVRNEQEKRVLKTKYSSPSITDDDEEDELGDCDFRDSESAELQLKTVKMYHEETDDERLKHAVVDEYDSALR